MAGFGTKSKQVIRYERASNIPQGQLSLRKTDFVPLSSVDAKKDNNFSPRAQVGDRSWNPDHHRPKKLDEFNLSVDGHRSGVYDHGKYNNLSDEFGHDSDDDDVVCEDGVCYRKGSKPKPNNNHLIGQDYYHDKERPKLGHNYSPPTSYTSVPKKDPYHEKTYRYKDNYNDPQLHKGNDYITPPYKVPMITSPPRNDHTRYEKSNNTHHPPPIKTRIDTHKAMELRKDYNLMHSPRSSAMHQPQYGSPRQDYQGRTETINSGEARRRYATALPRGGVYVEEKYAGTIDSVTAARKYKGVFVPN